jgi:hypothetical protein
MEQALTGLNCQVMPSTSDEAPGLLAYGEPAVELIALSAGWRDTILRNAMPDLTTIANLAKASFPLVRNEIDRTQLCRLDEQPGHATAK